MNKKLKEINLNPSTDQPYYPGYKTKIYNGYSGGMINNADSNFSRRMQVIMGEDEEEENEEDMILNKRKTKNGKFSLLETLEEIADEESIEEFDEIDLEEDIEEQVTIASGGIQGMTGPLGREKEKNISPAEYLQKEQIERMRILEAYHQKTSNKLK